LRPRDPAKARKARTPGRPGALPHRAETHATKLSVGERRLVLSALESGGGKLLVLSRRLGQPPGKLRLTALAENGRAAPAWFGPRKARKGASPVSGAVRPPRGGAGRLAPRGGRW